MTPDMTVQTALCFMAAVGAFLMAADILAAYLCSCRKRAAMSRNRRRRTWRTAAVCERIREKNVRRAAMETVAELARAMQVRAVEDGERDVFRRVA